MTPDLHVLFADNHCLVACKPARLLTASDDTGDPTLLAMVRSYHTARQAPGKKGYVAPLHFLDRPVSGAVMFALSSKAASRLSEQMRSRKIAKTYLAVVEGKPKPEATLVASLSKDKEANLTTVVPASTPGAKACELSYRCLAQAGGRALLEVKPRTGRSHQIRVQLADAGLPIYGDVKYGASAAWDGQIALHALSVEFIHPVAKTPVKVRAPVPPIWRQIWAGGLDV